MRRRPTTAVALGTAACVAGLAACAGAGADEGLVRAEGIEPRVVSVAEASALPDVVAATRRIGTVTLAAAPTGENAVVSPSSLAVALAMLAEGARTHTLAELDQVLGASDGERRDAFAALRGVLLEHDGDPAVVQADELPGSPLVHLAAQVVVDDQLDVDPAYLEALAVTFDAGAQRVDLGTSDGTEVLGSWVRHHSGGLIEDTAIEPDPDLRLVLQDAVVLAARWAQPFEEHATHDADFTLADGTVVQAETMNAMLDVAYAEVDGWRAARLEYVDALHADVVLPPEGTDPAGVTPELLTALDQELDAAAGMSVQVALPTLDISPEPLDLMNVFATLGAPSLPTAPDLSGLGPGDLAVQQAKQQAVLRVDEDGTVAAAVTEIGVGETSAPMPEQELRLDRPFLFSVAHTDTSWPLFLAAVRDPRH